MRRYKAGVERGQDDLFPPRLDDYVGVDNPVRAIDVYVESLDLEALGFSYTQVNRSAAGQPPFAPGAMLKLYLYGYQNRLRSSRCLERESGRNVEVMWLLKGLRPGYKSIANFRKDNAKALRAVHRDFILLCRQLKLLGGEKVAIDGSFFKGSASAKSFQTTAKLTKQIGQLEKQIEQWLGELDEADQREDAPSNAQSDPQLAQKLEQLKALQAQKATKERERQELEAAGKTQQSSTDPDAKLLNKRGEKVRGYNVQMATDSQHYLIVADEVTTDNNDLHQLYPLARQAKATLGVETLEVQADAGYCQAAQIDHCLQQSITPYVAIAPAKGSKDKDRLGREQFLYQPESDRYHCPGGHELKPQGAPREQNGMLTQRYMSRVSDCQSCALRTRCLSAKSRFREIWRHEHEELMQAHKERMAAHPEKMRERAAAVEHPFGTLKGRAGWTHFLVRGLEKVRGEWSLMALAYNFSRVLNIVELDRFRAMCAQRPSPWISLTGGDKTIVAGALTL